jgi:hypothetical protein
LALKDAVPSKWYLLNNPGTFYKIGRLADVQSSSLPTFQVIGGAHKMQNILILASCAETQRIAYDHPSQTIDLVWNDTRLRLCPHEFYCMVRLLEMGVFELELTELRQENCRLQQRRLG